MMTTELVLLLSIYAIVVFGSILKPDGGFKGTFDKSGPRLAAHIERNITVGLEFKDKSGRSVPLWTK